MLAFCNQCCVVWVTESLNSVGTDLVRCRGREDPLLSCSSSSDVSCVVRVLFPSHSPICQVMVLFSGPLQPSSPESPCLLLYLEMFSLIILGFRISGLTLSKTILNLFLFRMRSGYLFSSVCMCMSNLLSTVC